jgi:hypothetical protein
LTSAIDGGEWSASRFSFFNSGERTADAHWVRGCVGPKTSQDAVEDIAAYSSYQESNPGHEILSPSQYQLGYLSSSLHQINYN